MRGGWAPRSGGSRFEHERQPSMNGEHKLMQYSPCDEVRDHTVIHLIVIDCHHCNSIRRSCDRAKNAGFFSPPGHEPHAAIRSHFYMMAVAWLTNLDKDYDIAGGIQASSLHMASVVRAVIITAPFTPVSYNDWVNETL